MSKLFGRFAEAIARSSGKPLTFAQRSSSSSCGRCAGPLFGFSDTWQLVINTGTTIVTFLMVFLIQNTQNRDGAAIQAKLDELIRVERSAEPVHRHRAPHRRGGRRAPPEMRGPRRGRSGRAESEPHRHGGGRAGDIVSPTAPLPSRTRLALAVRA